MKKFLLTAAVLAAVPAYADEYNYVTLNVATFASGINNSDQIVGNYASCGFLYSKGKYTTLSDSLGFSTQPEGIK